MWQFADLALRCWDCCGCGARRHGSRSCARNCARASCSARSSPRAIRSNVDLFVIGLFTPIETVGSYGVARRIMDSSYLSIDAFNRLIYPRFARASRDGLHLALPAAKHALAAALGLGLATFLILFALAPELPRLFGREYHDLAFFVRCLSGTIILIGAWAVAMDLLGASGRQGTRALIMNSTNLLAAASSPRRAAPTGTFVALHMIESLVITAWLALLRLARRSRETRTRPSLTPCQGLSRHAAVISPPEPACCVEAER